MKIERLEKRITRLKEENSSLKAEIKKYQEREKYNEERLALADRTIEEYNGMISDLKEYRDQYQLIIRKLRQYDGKMMRRYGKAVSELTKELK